MIGQTIRSYNRTCTSLLSSQLLFSFRNHCIVPLTDSILKVNTTSPSPPSPPALYRGWTHKEPLVALCLLDSRPTRGQCAEVLPTLSVSSSMVRVGLSTWLCRACFFYSCSISLALFCTYCIYIVLLFKAFRLIGRVDWCLYVLLFDWCQYANSLLVL